VAAAAAAAAAAATAAAAAVAPSADADRQMKSTSVMIRRGARIRESEILNPRELKSSLGSKGIAENFFTTAKRFIISILVSEHHLDDALESDSEMQRWVASARSAADAILRCFERSLLFKQLQEPPPAVFPENHPDIGVMRMCVLI
jgi:hypothetical protein